MLTLGNLSAPSIFADDWWHRRLIITIALMRGPVASFSHGFAEIRLWSTSKAASDIRPWPTIHQTLIMAEHWQVLKCLMAKKLDWARKWFSSRNIMIDITQLVDKQKTPFIPFSRKKLAITSTQIFALRHHSHAFWCRSIQDRFARFNIVNFLWHQQNVLIYP